jgi:hypothetical protein
LVTADPNHAIPFAIDAGILGQVEDQEYLIVQGVYAAGTFTVGAGLTAGPDSLLIFDSNSSPSLTQGYIVLVGIDSTDLINIVNTNGLLTI